MNMWIVPEAVRIVIGVMQDRRSFFVFCECRKFMPSKPFVCVGAPEAMTGAETFEQIDRAIMEAITAGWPTWETPGQGGREPSRQRHKFESGSLVEGARIDFYRGQASDDWSNAR